MFNRVRKYSLRDKDSIRRLCLDNCDLTEKDDNSLASVLFLYCDYYLENESDTCFVAVDEKDEIIGYILCAPDFGRYSEIFGGSYVPGADKYGVKTYVEAKMNMIPYAMYKTQYPAHIHMDVSEEYQRLGVGTKMLDVMKKELISRGVPGMMLVCGEDNEVGRSFYEKNGFKCLLTTKIGISYAMELNK